LYRAPIRAIAVDTGGGENAVRYHQLTATDINLTITSGGGDNDIDVFFELSEPSTRPDVGTRRSQAVAAINLNASGGNDTTSVRWNSTAMPALTGFVRLTYSGRGLQGTGAEVKTSFEHGESGNPYVLGILWNGQSAPRDAVGDERSLVLDLGFAADVVDLELSVGGGAGRDEVEVRADYRGVRLQQGRVILDADFNEGDNRLDGYIVTSARHAHVLTNITAGDGDDEIAFRADWSGLSNIADGTSNTVLLSEVRLGHGRNDVQLGADGYGDSAFQVDAGDGDNGLVVRFLDGASGRRPPAGGRHVAATYRAGAGNNTVEIQGDATDTTEAEFLLDLGSGHNTVIKRWNISSTFPSRAQGRLNALPGGSTLTIHGDGADVLDGRLFLDITDPANPPQGAWSSKPNEIVVVGSRVTGTLDFLRLLGPEPRPAAGDPEWKYIPVRRMLALHGLQADVLDIELNSSDVTIARLEFGDITLKRGTIGTYDEHVDYMKVELEKTDLELEGLMVSGHAEVGTMSDGRALFRDVLVDYGATFSFNGVRIFDISDLDNPVPRSGARDVVIRGKKILQNSAVELQDFVVRGGGQVEIAMKVVGSDGRLTYTQDRVRLEAGADMTVRLEGGDGHDVIGVLLRGVSGGGNFRFEADAGAGNDFVAVLARDSRSAGDGRRLLNVHGGDGNDVLALGVVPEIGSDGQIEGRVDGGGGSNACFGAPGVVVENCDRMLEGSELLRLLRRLFVNSKEYTDEWSVAI
jgi:hypothetical protein